MQLIGLEEHFVTPDVLAAWLALPPGQRDLAVDASDQGEVQQRLRNLGEARLRYMDGAGIAMQVLSLTAPGMQSLEPQLACRLARRSNDLVAATVRAHPDRFQGFATLPTPAPEAAAKELERAVCELGLHGAMLFGRTGERNLDDPIFRPIFETAAALRAPLYLHPQSPVPAVRQAYYSGLGDAVDAAFATHGLGWHYETGVQLLRMILGGVFDNYPDLQIVTGHWGEVVLFYLERIAHLGDIAKLPRPVADYFRTNVFVTPSGIYSQRYLRWAIEVIGVDRIMFSADYPYAGMEPDAARRFLHDASLGESERAQIASGNWQRLCAGIRRDRANLEG
jgi:predicted TIM-barrel fold metal-dependent hydrolase